MLLLLLLLGWWMVEGSRRKTRWLLWLLLLLLSLRLMVLLMVLLVRLDHGLLLLVMVVHGRGEGGRSCGVHVEERSWSSNHYRGRLLRVGLLGRRVVHDDDGRVHVGRLHVDLGLLEEVDLVAGTSAAGGRLALLLLGERRDWLSRAVQYVHLLGVRRRRLLMLLGLRLRLFCWLRNTSRLLLLLLLVKLLRFRPFLVLLLRLLRRRLPPILILLGDISILLRFLLILGFGGLLLVVLVIVRHGFLLLGLGLVGRGQVLATLYPFDDLLQLFIAHLARDLLGLGVHQVAPVFGGLLVDAASPVPCVGQLAELLQHLHLFFGQFRGPVLAGDKVGAELRVGKTTNNVL